MSNFSTFTITCCRHINTATLHSADSTLFYKSFILSCNNIHIYTNVTSHSIHFYFEFPLITNVWWKFTHRNRCHYFRSHACFMLLCCQVELTTLANELWLLDKIRYFHFDNGDRRKKKEWESANIRRRKFAFFSMFSYAFYNSIFIDTVLCE